MILTATDRRVILALSGDLPESLTPFDDVGVRLGISREELLGRMERLRRSGVLRRFGATVDHRKIGFVANAMVVWRVPGGTVERAAKAIASSRMVSHCYEREKRPTWPYNLYAMLHARTREECETFAGNIARTIGSEEYKVLFTLREFRKASRSYFSSA
jgi:DNA-binding Lrp family transcriptional regulator